MQPAPGSGDSLHHTAPSPPLLDPHLAPRYIQALFPGKLLGWNTDFECGAAGSSNQANVWIQSVFVPQGSHGQL